MKSDVIEIDNKGNGFDEAVEASKKLAEFNKLDEKDILHLQLFAEEMLSMIGIVTGEVKASFWVENKDKTYDLNLTANTVMDKSKRDLLISSSSSKKNEAANSFLGKLRDAFEQAMLAESDTVTYQLPNNVASDVVGHYIENPEWDRYEASVLKQLADDVKIDIRGGMVHMIVSKTF